MMKTDSDKSETVAEAKSEATLAAPSGSEVPTPRTDELLMTLKVTPEYTKEKNTDRDRALNLCRRLERELAAHKIEITMLELERRSAQRELTEAAPYIEIGKRWRENSSLEEWFPFSAQKLKALEAEVGNAAAIIVKQNQERERENKMLVDALVKAAGYLASVRTDRKLIRDGDEYALQTMDWANGALEYAEAANAALETYDAAGLPNDPGERPEADHEH